MNKEQFYLTTPLYYSNAEPHIGHAYTTILADVVCRYQRSKGRQVHFLTGLDEHGSKVANEAAKNGMDPQSHCDLMNEKWRRVWEKLNIKYDDFIRTTEERHIQIVNDVLNKLYQKGDIYKKEYEGWYSTFEERFFTEKDLVDGLDPIGKRPVERLTEVNYFFEMSKYQEWLIDYYKSNSNSIIPDFRLNEVLGFLRQPLGDLCISRPKARLNWGIPIPWDNDFVTYVWFDALLNYYSATINPPEGIVVKWPAQYHLIAKDILTTHAVYWQTMLHAAGLEPPNCILTHGYWLSRDGVKMSKSIGNVSNPLEIADRYGVDGFRYVLMREMNIGYDSYYSNEIIVNRINTDLANDLGNLYSRLSKLWGMGKFEPTKFGADITDESLKELRSSLSNVVNDAYEQMKPHVALESVMQLIRGLNQYLEKLQPWKAVKVDSKSIHDDIAWALECLVEVAEYMHPVMPSKMEELRSSIVDEKGEISPKQGISLFPRIIEEFIEPVQLETPKPKKKKEPKKQTISIDDFRKIELVTGTVLSVSKHPSADKLLVLTVDLGDSTVNIVSGIAETYSTDDLVGKTVVVVKNLEKAKIRGEVSEGMILAATFGKEYRIITVDKEVGAGKAVS